jgi:hypothetical protein
MLLTPYTHGNWPIWIVLHLNVSYRRNMETICITMVAIEMEQFGDYGKIIRLKMRTTIHLTRLNPSNTLFILCALYIYCTFLSIC